jgi:hypothetical protein
MKLRIRVEWRFIPNGIEYWFEYDEIKEGS